MQRWIRLPQGGFLDASHVIFIGKIESFARLDDEHGAAEFAAAEDDVARPHVAAHAVAREQRGFGF